MLHTRKFMETTIIYNLVCKLSYFIRALLNTQKVGPSKKISELKFKHLNIILSTIACDSYSLLL